MKRSLIIVVVLLVAFTADAGHKKKRKKQLIQSKGIQSVTMRRTGCYGRCPEYTITLKRDGTITWHSIRNTKDTGTFTKNVGKEVTADVMNNLMNNKVDTCRRMYFNRVPDLPGVGFTVQYADSTKEIRNANFGPMFLGEVANKLEELGKEHDGSWQRAPTRK